MNQVLIVDDEAGMRAALVGSFAGRGWHVESANGVHDALSRFQRKRHALVVTDIRMGDGDGFSVMRAVRELEPQTAVVLLTAYGNVPDAVAAVKEGACDYLVKPVAFEQLEAAAQKVLQQRQHASTNHSKNISFSSRGKIIGNSPAWLRAMERARQAAASNADILIQAESGSGKEVVARMIHDCSDRRHHPFVAVNCAAFPEQLLESELFGHAKGAFTGALGARAGKFELADGGTLLLDEAGELPLSLQPKLLRVLQEREFDRLGDTRTVKVDIRIIATTNRPLEQMVREGTFRADLYYRLNVIPLRLPSLRERQADVRALAEYFAGLYAGEKAIEMDPELFVHLEQHPWPGNVRELANLMRRAVALTTGKIGPEILRMENAFLPQERTSRFSIEPAKPGISLDQAERDLISATLEATEGNRSRAAEMLGVSLRTVRNKIREYGLPARKSYSHV